jgi:hypothetical protein
VKRMHQLLAGKEHASGTTSEASTLWSFKSGANYFFVGPDFFLAPLPHWRSPKRPGFLVGG